MRKTLFSIMTLMLVVGLVGGGAFAYFSDTETSTLNSFTAGTLNLGLANASGTDPVGSTIVSWSSPANWAPGGTEDGTISVNNEGTIAGNDLEVSFDYGTVVDGMPVGVDAGPGGPTDNLDDMIIATTVTFDGGALPDMQGKSLFYLKANSPFNVGSLAANTEKPFRILWTFDSTATNGCQGDSVVVDLNFALYQDASIGGEP